MSVNKWFKWRDKQHSRKLATSEDEDLKPFLDHLEDFRWMIIKSIAAGLIGMIIAFPLGPKMLYLLQRPLLSEGQRLQEMMLVRPEADKPAEEDIQQTISRMQSRLQTIEEQLSISPSAPGAAQSEGEGKGVKETSEPEKMEAPAQWLSRFFISTGPAEPFILWLKLSGWAGLIIALPFIIFFIAEFVFPGLTDKERKLLLPSAGSGLGLFMVGLAFCYYMVLPRALQIMIGIHGMMGMSVAWKLPEYIIFVTRLLLAFGVAFEMPLVVIALVKLGLVSAKALREKRRHVIVGFFIMAMILTPPDIFTQVMLAIPMVLLFEICIWLATIIEKREKSYWDEEEGEDEEKEKEKDEKAKKEEPQTAPKPENAEDQKAATDSDVPHQDGNELKDADQDSTSGPSQDEASNQSADSEEQPEGTDSEETEK